MIETKWLSVGVSTDAHAGCHLHVRIWKIELYVGFSKLA